MSEPIMNLSFQETMMKRLVKSEDSAVAEYISQMSRYLVSKGEDLTQYTITRVSNPLQLKDDENYKITWSYRLIKISDLESAPTYYD